MNAYHPSIVNIPVLLTSTADVFTIWTPKHRVVPRFIIVENNWICIGRKHRHFTLELSRDAVRAFNRHLQDGNDIENANHALSLSDSCYKIFLRHNRYIFWENGCVCNYDNKWISDLLICFHYFVFISCTSKFSIIWRMSSFVNGKDTGKTRNRLHIIFWWIDCTQFSHILCTEYW